MEYALAIVLFGGLLGPALGRDWREQLAGAALGWAGAAGLLAAVVDWRLAALRVALAGAGLALLSAHHLKSERREPPSSWPLRLATLALALTLAIGLVGSRHAIGPADSPLAALTTPAATAVWALLLAGAGTLVLASSLTRLGAALLVTLAGLDAVLALGGVTSGVGVALVVGGAALAVGAIPWLRPRERPARLR